MAGVVLDHLAFAVQDWSAGRDTLSRRLGGRWSFGLDLSDFRMCQLAYGNETRIELLAPPSRGTSFIDEFLAATPDAGRPHHITFKTDDVEAAIGRAQDFGIEPILVSLDNQVWREAFLHPRDTGLGVLIQIVESVGDPLAAYAEQLDCPWSVDEAVEQARLEHIDLVVDDVAANAELLHRILAGEVRTTDDPGVLRVGWRQGAELVLVAAQSKRELKLGVDTIAFGPPLSIELEAGGNRAATPVDPEFGVRLVRDQGEAKLRSQEG